MFNGALGTVVSVNLEEQEITVLFDERHVTDDRADLNEISLAWAVTIHQSQGSEYPSGTMLMANVYAALPDAQPQPVVHRVNAGEEAGDFSEAKKGDWASGAAGKSTGALLLSKRLSRVVG